MIDRHGTSSAVVTFAVSPSMRQSIAEMVAPGLTGRLEVIQMESAALMYLTMLARVLTQAESPVDSRLTKSEQKRVARAHDRLLASMQDPPTLEELSMETGMSRKRLNNAFRERYGGSVFEVLQERRLTLARELLQSGHEPIKRIAWQVGYAHVSNFTTAFKRRFGVTPGEVARSSE